MPKRDKPTATGVQPKETKPETKVILQIDRPQVCNIDAECAVLGAMMMADVGKKVIEQVLGIGLIADDFYRIEHQSIYNAIMRVYRKNQGVDLLTVTRELETCGEIEKIGGGVGYLDELIDSCPTADNAEYYARILIDKSTERNLVRLNIQSQAGDIQTEDHISGVEHIVDRWYHSRPIISRAEPISAVDLLASDLPVPPMIISKGLLPANGYTMVASYTKHGKSTFVMQMCLSICNGFPFLGFPIEKKARILYCYTEGSPAGMKELIKAQVDNWGSQVSYDNLSLLDAHELCLQERAGVNFLKSNIQKTQAELCVIDPIALAMASDINDIRTIRTLVKTLQAISADTLCSWLLVHHFGKPPIQKREPILRMLGSSGFGNYCESFIGLERFSEKRSPDYMKVSFELRGGPRPDDLCLYLNKATRLFELVYGPDVPDMPFRKIPALSIDRVVDILKEQGQPISHTLLVELIKTQLGITERPARELISEAKKAGKIVKDEGRFGKYFIF